MSDRMLALKKNFSRMFFVRAFVNLRTINAVMAIFYLHRGVSLSEIFYMSLVWAGATLLFEVPSSYLADRWGRKNTILLAIFLSLIQWVVFLYAHGFWWFAFGMALYGISYACFSGTDEALVYDTEKELGEEPGTLAKLGKYKAATTTFKIFTPIIGAVIARDLVDWQFNVLLLIDIVGCLISFIIASTLTEPNHNMDVQKMEQGVLKDGIRTIRTNPQLLKMIVNKEFTFFAVFIPWCYYQSFYVGMGLTIVTVGIGYGLKNFASFLGQWFVRHLTKHNHFALSIDRLNIAVMVCLFALLVSYHFSLFPLLVYILLLAAIWCEDQRQPYFSELFHKQFTSYNRATTASLTNVLHNVIEFPLLIVSGILIAKSDIYPYYFAFLLAVVVVLFLYLHSSSAKTAPSL